MNAWHLEGKIGFESNRAKVFRPGKDNQDEWVANRTTDECIKKSMINENENDQNIGSDDDDDQCEFTENECEDLVNVLQKNVTLSFENMVEISEEEKIMI